MFGWIAVDMYFVLSGFLIGKLILDRQDHANFFTVFYVRRCCRILPAYFLTVLALSAAIAWIDRPWVDAAVRFPLWSYFTFNQGFLMVATQSIGAHWLAPTWTLAVEEHFYLLMPALIVFTPRRWLVGALIAMAALALALRVAVYGFGVGNEMLALAILPSRADVLVAGILAAIAVRRGTGWLARVTPFLRLAPILMLLATFLLGLIGPTIQGILGPTCVAIGCAAFLLCLVLETPEAARFKSRILRFFGDNGYCLYLVHLPILGLMHGAILGATPDLMRPAQWFVTLGALPVTVLVGWGMTRLIEEPLTRYGRTWRWSEERRDPSAEAGNLPQAFPPAAILRATPNVPQRSIP